MTRRAVVPATAIVVVLALAPVGASSPKFFQAATQADFLKGDVENLSIDNRGQLVLGPVTELVYETSAPFLWAMLAMPDGSLFVGTGNEGKVFKIDAQGKGSLFFDSAELEVHALAPAPNGGLYVGTSPDGKIYKVDRNGSATEFFDPDDKYIWALAVDAKGNVYAGTGEKGVIYKITPDGKGTVFYKTNTTHATALAFDKAGNLLVGTGSPGKVLRIDPDGKPFVLLDSPFQEIRALRFDDKGMLYVAALSGRPPSGGSVGPDGLRDARADVGRAAGAGAVGLGRDHVHRDRRLVGRAATRARLRATIGGRRAASTASRRTASGISSGNRATTRPTISRSIRAARSSSAPAARARSIASKAIPLRPTLLARASAQQVTAFYKDPPRTAVLRDREPGQAVPAVAGPRRSRHLRVRGARRADGGDVGRDQLARNGAGRQSRRALHAVGQHRDAGRHLERLVGGLHEPGEARRSRARRRATCSGAPCSREKATARS